MANIKQYEKEINDAICEQVIARRQRNQREPNEKLIKSISGHDNIIFAPLSGYKLKKLANNKPLTLLSEKAKAGFDFVAFVNIYEYDYQNNHYIRKAFFNINDDKKTISCGYPCEAITNYAYNDARKDPGEIFILTNKMIKTYGEKWRKHNQREQAKHTPTGNERFINIKESYIFNNLINQFFNYHRSCYSYNYRYYSYNKDDFDKSGYFLKYKREELQEKAKKLKAQREQERKEREQEKYISNRALRGSFIVQLDNSKSELISIIENFNNFSYTLRNNKVLKFIIAVNDLIDIINEKIAILQDDANTKNNHENATKYTQRASDYVKIVKYLLNHINDKLSYDFTDYLVKDNKVLIDYDWRAEHGYFMCEGFAR